jgi:arylsulfatase A-like enzyme
MQAQTRREFLQTLAIGAGMLALPGCITLRKKTMSADSNKLPNIVFIMADDMGYGDVGCNGSTKIPTPNIDALAEKGMQFTDAHTQSAVCTPTRYGVMTGRYCWRTRLKASVATHWDTPLIEPERMTVASLLKKYGYATGCFGKWHLGLGWQPKKPGDDISGWSENGEKIDFTKPFTGGPLELGFDEYFGISSSINMLPYAFLDGDRTVGIPSVPKEPAYDTDSPDGLTVPGWKTEDAGPAITERAVQFIRNHHAQNLDKPFFLYFPTATPHRPCVPPDFAKGKSQAGARGDMVWEFDWAIGQVMDTLDELGLRDNTLVIVTSDNGGHAGDPLKVAEWLEKDTGKQVELKHPKGPGSDIWVTYGHDTNGRYLGYKSQIWDGGHRVPFIASWPGKIPAGTVSDELVCLTDFIATVAAIVGEELPENAAEDSYNILPALLGQQYDSPIREALVHHSSRGGFAIRQGKWKLIFCKGHAGWYGYKEGWLTPETQKTEGQLYDMESDPGEMNNVYEEHPEIVSRLTELLDKYKREGRS